MTMTEIIEACLERAEAKESSLTSEVIGAVGGFCGEKFRHLLNNLGHFCTSYLEIGSLHGASLTSTCYGNGLDAIAIENFSEFDGKRETLTANAKKYAPEAYLVFGDCWLPETVVQVPEGKIDLFFYDGCHSKDAHERALREYASRLAAEFIYLVDDWNWPHVKEAAMRGINASGYKVVYQRQIACPDGDGGGWWNGVGIFVLRK
jgi:hypothetical protein